MNSAVLDQRTIELLTRKRWTLRELKCLATKKTDAALALSLQRPISEIRSMRKSWKFSQAANQGRPWTGPELKLLGTLPDGELSRRLKRPLNSVRNLRLRLNIPILRAQRKWHPDEIALLGKIRDRELAAQLGVNVATVTACRCSRGIACFQPRIQYWSKPEETLLGTGTDLEVAQALGRTEFAVSARRRHLGISSPNHKRRPWSQHELDLLGSKPDDEIARMLNRSVQSIRAQRFRKQAPVAGCVRARTDCGVTSNKSITRRVA